MSHDVDDVLAQCQALAQEIGQPPTDTTMTLDGLRMAVTARFAWLRYENDIQLVMGMLAANLSAHGWRIVWDEA
jgi:hypothetical protein